MTKKIVLIDGHGLLHRAYHALPPLTTSDGELINAVYGFTRILLNVLNELKPEYVIVAFDKKGPTFRHKEFKEYKAHRPEMDKELAGQIERVKEVVSTLGIPYYAKENYEADDLIGTFCKQARNWSKVKGQRSQVKEEIETVIVSSDKDLLQLLNGAVKVYFPKRGKRPAKIVQKSDFEDEYGFPVKYFVDYKALIGDPSDGLPGVKGIGPKTASRLINEYATLEEIYQNLESISKGVRKKLEKYQEEAFMSKQLAQIVQNVPVELDLKGSKLKDYDKDKITSLFEKLEFRSLIKELPKNSWEEEVLDIFAESEVKEKKETQKEKQIELF